MELTRHEPGMISELDHLHEGAVRRLTGAHETGLLELSPQSGIHFVAMPVTFVDEFVSVRRRGLRSLQQLAWIRAEPHRPAHLVEILAGEDVDHGVRGRCIELGRVGVL
jgi:hypothetical protein